MMLFYDKQPNKNIFFSLWIFISIILLNLVHSLTTLNVRKVVPTIYHTKKHFCYYLYKKYKKQFFYSVLVPPPPNFYYYIVYGYNFKQIKGYLTK